MIANQSSAFADWLADFYLLSTILLAIGLTVMSVFRQPSRRMAVARSIATGLAALAAVAVAPTWPRVCAITGSTSSASVGSLAESRRSMIELADTPSSAESNSINLAASQPLASPAPNQASLVTVPRAQPPLAARELPPRRSILVAAFACGAAANLLWLALGATQAVHCAERRDR